MTLLAARSVRGGYGAEEVVRGVDLDLAAGQCVALLGPNGAGKTTLVRLLAGILPLAAGEVRLGERDLRACRRREVARALAFVPQRVHFTFPLTVKEVVEQGRAPHLGPWRPATPADHAAVADALALLGLDRLAGRPVHQLSGGEQQRVLLARALATQARLLLLDEPATALDVRHQLVLVATLRVLLERGVGVLLVVHDWNLALQVAHRVVVLSDGRVAAAGPPEEVAAPELFRRVFGVEVEILRRPEGPPTVVPVAPAPDPSGQPPAEGGVATRQTRATGHGRLC